MAEKDADNNCNSSKNSNNSKTLKTQSEEDDVLDKPLERRKEENDYLNFESHLPSCESSLKKEENPFSFKKFLHQDSSTQKSKGARKKTYTPPSVSTSCKLNLSNHDINNKQPDFNTRMVSSTDMSSVLPDFVQDHLVIEQCYLNSDSTIDIDNLNLHNLPDLNLEHGNIHFKLNTDSKINSNHNSSENLSSNLPDFTLGARHFDSVTQNRCNKKGLPDFTLNVGAKVTNPLDTNCETTNNSTENSTNTRDESNNENETSHQLRHRAQISSSPSVPLDLPSYENSESSQNLTIPFDLTIPAEEKNGSRGMASAETVSKSLPDFLSDGPIKKEFNENLQNVRGNISSLQNGLPPQLSTTGPEYERLLREVELLRRQVAEKNRRLIYLESELEHLHSTDQRETASLEYALQEVEKNLKQTAKRALNAEDMVRKLKQENKLLKSEVCTLRSENLKLNLGNHKYGIPASQEVKNNKIAKELKSAANIAENSLRTLLAGIENLRSLASSMESSHESEKRNEEEYQDFLQEDSASGPAL